MTMWSRVLETQINRTVYSDEHWPHELVIVLHRRSLELQRLRLIRRTLSKALLPVVVKHIGDFLKRRPYYLTSNYLTRMQVPIGRVFLTLRQWFHEYGKLPVPRALRQLVSVDPAHLCAVKREEAEASPPVVAMPAPDRPRVRRHRT